MQYLSKIQIVERAESIFRQFSNACTAFDEADFFVQPNGKWSVAENVQHLVTSTNTTTLAFTLPAFVVRLLAGKPNRESRSYEDLVSKYKTKLAEGGRASGRFIPTRAQIKKGKGGLLKAWQQATEKFIHAIKNKTSETKLDDYLVRHPLLGRITLRELCYFTIYHTEHHLNIIQQTKGNRLKP